MNKYNANVLLSQIFIDALIESGLEAICVAPGSRSTPLTIAASQRRNTIEVYSVLDERSAAFFAMGMAKISQKPVALISTSGSALANFMPAVVEAEQSGIPLILLTADRPHRLRNSGANQTIDQIKFYGSFVKRFVEMPPPRDKTTSFAQVRAEAARGYSVAEEGGVVHFNFPFDKPLENSGELKSVSQFRGEYPRRTPKIKRTSLQIDEETVETIVSKLGDERGIIVFGPVNDVRNIELVAAVNVLSRYLGYPILADPLSNLRISTQVGENIISGYETFLQSDKVMDYLRPDVILQFGRTVTSKYLLRFLETSDCFRIQLGDRWSDESFRTDLFVGGDTTDLISALVRRIDSPQKRSGEYLKRYRKMERYHRDKVSEYVNSEKTDASIIANIVQNLPNRSNVFASNSLSIRNIDQFILPFEKDVHIFGNRGASGIDGNISTAAGIALFTRARMNVIFIGDLAFLHDLNALLTVHKYQINLKIVVMNNSGGGIFHRLPISDHKEVFPQFFLTPQNVDIEGLARGFNIRYRLVKGRENFQILISEEILDPSPVVIEVRTDSSVDHQTLEQFVQRYLSELDRAIA